MEVFLNLLELSCDSCISDAKAISLVILEISLLKNISVLLPLPLLHIYSVSASGFLKTFSSTFLCLPLKALSKTGSTGLLTFSFFFMSFSEDLVFHLSQSARILSLSPISVYSVKSPPINDSEVHLFLLLFYSFLYINFLRYRNSVNIFIVSNCQT